MPDVRTFPDLATLSAAAAAEIAGIAQASVASRGRFTIALAGGGTPRQTYELLGTMHRDAIDWARTHVLFGDERFVAQSDPRSNYKMVEDALLRRVPIPATHVHPIPTDTSTADEAAEQYDSTLHSVLSDHTTDAGGGDPVTGAAATVDLALLGVGADGHTASLFPGAPALDERQRWTRAVDAPTSVQPAVPRITTTFPFLNGARAVFFLVAGEDKRRVVSEILARGPSARTYPAALVAPRGRVLWLIERSAAPAGIVSLSTEESRA
jgi:6-phosphogluconolactonase